MKVDIDRENCISCGACAQVCPDVFMMDDDGKASVTEKYRKGGPAVGDVPEEMTDCANSAAEGCPVNVIKVD